MMFGKMSRRAIRSYCRMVTKAADLGVPIDDIISETRKFHGETFTEEVIKRLHSI
ncbi:MAG: hypothetical protein FWG13_03945 [Leptospirales bacterium]|nr:hypothetical protein [Leptospirales bacterium]